MADDGSEPTFAETAALRHDPDAVWALLADVPAAARCVPGLALDSAPRGRPRVDPEGDTYAARLSLGIGPLRKELRGGVRVRDANPSTRTLRLGLSGEGAEEPERVGVTLRVEPDGEGSRVRARVCLSGRGGHLAGGWGGDVARLLLRRFARRLDAAID